MQCQHYTTYPVGTTADHRTIVECTLCGYQWAHYPVGLV